MHIRSRRFIFTLLALMLALMPATAAFGQPLGREAPVLGLSEPGVIADSYIDDPGWSRLAWTKYTRENEAAALGARLWPLGVAANRANLERFISYSYEQGIIEHRIAVDELFHESMHGT